MGRRVVVEADGGSRGNPGPAGYGAVVRDAATGEILAERADGIGVASNNVAEYRGLIAGLTAVAELDDIDSVDVAMDSKLVVEQMSGRWQVKHPDMKVLAREAAGLVRRLPRVTFRHIPREQNKHADRLANEAMDAQAAGRRWTSAASAEAPLTEEVPEPSPRPSRAMYGWSTGVGRRTRLWLVRHGETPHTTDKRFSGGGRSDPALTERGVAQARATAAHLAQLTTGVDVVVTSPLQRARQTADAVGEALGVPVVVDDGFAETGFGEWDGRTLAEVEERWPSELAAWLGDTSVAPPGGESFEDTWRRVRAARGRVMQTYGGQEVVVVAHVTPLKLLVGDVLGARTQALFRLHMSPASVSGIDWYDDRQEGVVTLFNDAAHLGDLGAPHGA